MEHRWPAGDSGGQHQIHRALNGRLIFLIQLIKRPWAAPNHLSPSNSKTYMAQSEFVSVHMVVLLITH